MPEASTLCVLSVDGGYAEPRRPDSAAFFCATPSSLTSNIEFVRRTHIDRCSLLIKQSLGYRYGFVLADQHWAMSLSHDRFGNAAHEHA